MAMKRIADLRVAVVGYGSMGRRHEENLALLDVRQRVVVRRLANPNPAFVPPPECTVVHSATEALSLGIDAAVVCVPTRLHVDAALEFVEAGVPVLLEKPIGDDLARASQLVEAARDEKNVLASMAYCMRYHPAYAATRWAVNSGHLGQVVYAKAWFESFLPTWHPWEDYRESYAARSELGGGVLPTLDHEIDFLNWCLGRPEKVSGMQVRSGMLRGNVSDVATLQIMYPSDVLATVCQSLCRRDRSRGFELVGHRGTLRYSEERNRLEFRDAGQCDGEVLWDGLDFDPNEMYLAMLRDFLQAVCDRRPPPVPLECGLDALSVMTRLAEPQSTELARTTQ